MTEPNTQTFPNSYSELIASERAETRELVDVERNGGSAVVRLNDPKKLNALAPAMVYQIRERLEELTRDPDVRTVVLTGTDPAFSAGGDIESMQSLVHPFGRDGEEGSAAVWRWIRHHFSAVARLIHNSEKIFISAINGPAAGAAFGWSISCDIVVASEKAMLIPAFGKVGLAPEVGLSWLLNRKVGYHKAFEMVTRSQPITAEEALELGLVSEVVPHDELMTKALKWAERIERLPDYAPELAKSMLRNAADMTWEQATASEEIAQAVCFTTKGHRDAVSRFLGGS